jgi:prophage regulatory protein
LGEADTNSQRLIGRNPGGLASLLTMETAMRFLSKKQVTALVLYSGAHIARLEKARKFPARVNLGQCRVGWVEVEVLDWMQARVAERDRHTGS